MARTVKNILAAGQDRLPLQAAETTRQPNASAAPTTTPRRRCCGHFNAMKLGAMADAVQQQLQSGEAATLGFRSVSACWSTPSGRPANSASCNGACTATASSGDAEAVDFSLPDGSTASRS